MWYYIQSEPGLWTVGCDTDRGWTTDSDHDVQEAAAQRVSFLNGNTDDFVRHLIAERANLRQQLAAAQEENAALLLVVATDTERVEELQQQLAAAQTELHELRVRVGTGEAQRLHFVYKRLKSEFGGRSWWADVAAALDVAWKVAHGQSSQTAERDDLTGQPPDITG